MTPNQIRTWLADHGFVHVGPYAVKGPVRITFLKASVRVEIRLKSPIYKYVHGKRFTTTHQRISGARFAQIGIDDAGNLQGLGFTSNDRLNEFVYHWNREKSCLSK